MRPPGGNQLKNFQCIINPQRRAEDRMSTSERYAFGITILRDIDIFDLFPCVGPLVPIMLESTHAKGSTHFHIFTWVAPSLRNRLLLFSGFSTHPRHGPHQGTRLGSHFRLVRHSFASIYGRRSDPSPPPPPPNLPRPWLLICRRTPSYGLHPYPLLATSMFYLPIAALVVYKSLPQLSGHPSCRAEIISFHHQTQLWVSRRQLQL